MNKINEVLNIINFSEKGSISETNLNLIDYIFKDINDETKLNYLNELNNETLFDFLKLMICNNFKLNDFCKFYLNYCINKDIEKTMSLLGFVNDDCFIFILNYCRQNGEKLDPEKKIKSSLLYFDTNLKELFKRKFNFKSLEEEDCFVFYNKQFNFNHYYGLSNLLLKTKEEDVETFFKNINSRIFYFSNNNFLNTNDFINKLIEIFKKYDNWEKHCFNYLNPNLFKRVLNNLEEFNIDDNKLSKLDYIFLKEFDCKFKSGFKKEHESYFNVTRPENQELIYLFSLFISRKNKNIKEKYFLKNIASLDSLSKYNIVLESKKYNKTISNLIIFNFNNLSKDVQEYSYNILKEKYLNKNVNLAGALLYIFKKKNDLNEEIDVELFKDIFLNFASINKNFCIPMVKKLLEENKISFLEDELNIIKKSLTDEEFLKISVLNEVDLNNKAIKQRRKI